MSRFRQGFGYFYSEVLRSTKPVLQVLGVFGVITPYSEKYSVFSIGLIKYYEVLLMGSNVEFSLLLLVADAGWRSGI